MKEGDYSILSDTEISSNILISFKDGNQPFVAKCFVDNRLYEKEVLILSLCLKNNIKSSELIYCEENSEENFSWILYRYIEGVSLDKIKIEDSEKFHLLFYETGMELAKFHKMNSSFIQNENIQNVIKKNKIRNERNLRSINIDNKLFHKAFSFLRNNDFFLDETIFYSVTINDFHKRHIILENKKNHY